ncbi:hypothetical protein LQ948_09860 [Jiella sp. MQZ9-1]|uniref:Right-handed parallel beta-helix repeat-containing protein n=1 Tax=Jiella flava TaxID=2816857 RepID=A0A939JSL7_9HYPH|nr:right-handed parallel beta-helix repeat-containing protein [Jiella flava]MBO0663093.1 right-handed parallel beta-helix repeat-containing protein [Jiella flava]MCD2471512.1 hypothetical protein [Jiella flava]
MVSRRQMLTGSAGLFGAAALPANPLPTSFLTQATSGRDADRRLDVATKAERFGAEQSGDRNLQGAPDWLHRELLMKVDAARAQNLSPSARMQAYANIGNWLPLPDQSALEASAVPRGIEQVTLLDEGASYQRAGSRPDRFAIRSQDGAWWQKASTDPHLYLPKNVRTLRSFGCRGDGKSDDLAAVQTALKFPGTLDGENLTYAVRGEIKLPDNGSIMNATFKQLDPGHRKRSTVSADGVNGLRLINLRVDRNGSGRDGGLETHFGIRIANGSGHLFQDVEVFGDNLGTGFGIQNCHDFDLIRPWVHDIKFVLPADPMDDRVQGIWISNSSNWRAYAPKVSDLGGSVNGGASFAKARTRGFVVGLGSGNFSIFGGQISRCDQGLDITGSNGNTYFAVYGLVAEECSLVGIKLANFNRHGKIDGCSAIRCGSLGFLCIASGDRGVETDDMPRDVVFRDCQAIDTGFDWERKGFPVPGAFIVSPSNVYKRWPKGVKLRNCRAIWTKPPEHPMYGFWNNVAYSGGEPNTVDADCVVTGNPDRAKHFLGWHHPECWLRAATVQSIPNSKPTNLVLEAAIDSMKMLNQRTGQAEIRLSGQYRVETQVSFKPNPINGRQIRILKNGEVLQNTEATVAGVVGFQTTVRTSFEGRFEEGDTVGVEVLQNSGAPLDLHEERGATWLCVRRLHAI